MQSANAENSEIQIEIQKTLISINDITMKINGEMKMINETIKENGQYDAALTETKEKLMRHAQDLGLDVNDILSKVVNQTTVQFLETHLDSIVQKLSSNITED